MNKLLQQIALLALIFVTAFAVQAEDYTSGHNALQLWDDEARANLPQWIKIWLMILGVTFMSGLLFVWKHVEARWLVGGALAGILMSRQGAIALGLAPLSGWAALAHVICWSPALYIMLKNRPFLQGLSPYSVWSGLATACILFSFIFDIRDTAIYLMHMLGDL